MERLLLFACFAFTFANANVCQMYPEDQNLPGLEGKFFDLYGFRLHVVFDCKIHGTSRNDSGNYTCVARTKKGIFLYNKTIDITITEPGQMIADQEGNQVNATESRILKCNVYEDLYRTSVWQLEFEYGSGLDLTNLGITAYDDANGFGNTLNITSVKAVNDKVHTCRAHYSRRTPITDTIDSYSVRPLGVGSVVHIFNVSTTWRNIRIMHKKNGTAKWCFHSEAISNGKNGEKIITGLENGTAYLFKIVAIKDGGHLPTAYSSWITTWEKDFIPTVRITATTLNSISFEWLGVPQELDWGYIQYQLTATHAGVKIMKWSSKDSYDTIHNLESNTSYGIAVTVCASEKHCSHHSSAEQTAVTMDRVIQLIPILTVEDTTPHSITIGWSAPPPAELRDRVHQYKVVATRQGQEDAPVYLPKTVNLFNFENLTSNASYLVKVAACSEYETQCGSWSSGQNVRTVHAAPKFVPKIKIKDKSIDSISVEWSSPPAELQDPVHQYKVAATRRGEKEVPVYLLKTEYFYVFENLTSTSTTSYLVRVAACSKDKMQCEMYPEDQNLPGLEGKFFNLYGFRLHVVFDCKIHGTSRNDSGNYTCVARTRKGIFLYNKTIDITITEPGQMIADQDGNHVNATESRILKCNVYEDLYRTFVWQLEFEYGSGLDLTNLRITAYDDANGFGNTLNITSVKAVNDKVHTCRAHYSRRTPITDTIDSYSVRPLGVGSVVHIFNVLTTWKNIRIMHKKNGTEKWCFHSEAISNGKNGEKIITGLENGTAYLFKIVAIKDGGHLPTAYSSWITTWEKDFIPTVRITATTLNSISFEWLGVPQELDWGYIQYQLTATHAGVKIMKWSSKDSYDTIHNLESNTSYGIAVTVCASEKHCSHHSSAEQTAVTMDRVIQLIPILTVEDTTPHSITIGWSAPPPAELRDRVHQYKVVATRQGQEDAPVYLPKTVNLFNFENLTSNASYLVKVAACSEYETQCGSWSSGQNVRTVHAAPKFVPKIKIKDKSIDSISVEWSSPPAELQDPVHQYKVAATRRGEKEVPVYLRKTEYFYVFENLTSTTSYLVRVAACSKDKMQCGNWSTTLEILTIDKVGKTRDVIWVNVIVAAVLINMMMAVWIGIRKRREMAARRRFIEATLERFNRGDLDRLNPAVNIANQAEFLPYDKKWEFPRELLRLDEVLGSGAFGVVRKAKAKSICHSESVTTVAVKLVRSTSSLNQMTALSRELKILVHLGKHVNVVNLLGACTKKVSFGQLMVIVEFCRFGNLRDYLLRRRDVFIPEIDQIDENTKAGSNCSVNLVPANESGMDTAAWDCRSATRDCSHSTDPTNTSMAVGYQATDKDLIEPRQLINYQGDDRDDDLELISTQDLLSWSWQVARGMKYLGFRRVVHGDLAARNILLADHNVVKICDFGLAKNLYENDNHCTEGHGPLPVKWLAIESLRDHVFSFHSDVWAYGVVLWELFSLAETPYSGIRHDTLYKKLADGFRMPKPKYATRDIYKTMLRCWNAEPSQRPSFAELVNSIGDLLDENVKTEYFDLSGPYEQMNVRDLELGGRDYLTMTPSKNTSNTIEETQQQSPITNSYDFDVIIDETKIILDPRIGKDAEIFIDRPTSVLHTVGQEVPEQSTDSHDIHQMT